MSDSPPRTASQAAPPANAQPWEFRILGPLQVRSATGAELEIPIGKQRLLLSALISQAGVVLPRHRLVEILWPQEMPDNPRKALQHYVGRLRSVLGDGIVRTAGEGYVLAAPPMTVDAVRFADLASRGMALASDDPAQALVILETGLALWRADPYADAAESPFAVAERARLTALRELAEDARVDALLALGEHDAVLPPLIQATTNDPSRERRWGQLMLALYRAGRQGEALAAYQRARALLADELGVAPGPELRDLQLRILQQDPALGGAHRVAAAGLAPRPVHRPASTFVGRTESLTQLGHLLSRGRIVTVRGPVGVGKTRLVTEWATRQQEGDGPAPVALVALDSVSQSQLIPTAVASACGITENPSRDAMQQLVDGLRGRAVTLILDGCDRHLDAVRTLLDRLARSCPRVRFVCTAMSAMGLLEESQLMLAGLPHRLEPGAPLPDGVRLFLDRAEVAGVAPDRLAPRVEVVGAIVEALDGIPLAIELAAARSQTASLEDILSGIVTGNDPLSSRLHGIPSRHSSLHSALDWTLSRLTPDARELLDELAVLPGPFTRDTANAVAGTAGDDLAVHLEDLVDHSLLRAEQEVPWVSLSIAPPTRRYVAGRHGSASAAALQRMIEHHAKLAAQIDLGLRGAHQRAWLRRADLEQENLVHAMSVALEARPSAAQAIAAHLGRYWDWRGQVSQANHAYAQVAGIDAGDADEYTLTAMWACFFAWEGGHGPEAASMVRTALSRGTGRATGSVTAASWGMLGLISSTEGRARAALDELQTGLELVPQEDWVSGWLSTALVACHLQAGDDTAAARHARRALDAFRLLGDSRAQGWALLARAQVLSHRNRFADAAAAASDAVSLADAAQDPRTVAAALELEARNQLAQERLDRAAALLAAVQALQLRRGTPLPPSKAADHLDVMLQIEDGLGHARFADAWARGAAADVRDLIGSASGR